MKEIAHPLILARRRSTTVEHVVSLGPPSAFSLVTVRHVRLSVNLAFVIVRHRSIVRSPLRHRGHCINVSRRVAEYHQIDGHYTHTAPTRVPSLITLLTTRHTGTVAGATSLVVCENCPVETPNSSPGSSASTDCTSSLVCAGNTQPSVDGTTCVSGCSNGNYFSQVTKYLSTM